MIKLKSLISEYRKAVILSPSKAKKMIDTIKKQERVSKVFKHKASYDGKMTTIYSIDKLITRPLFLVIMSCVIMLLVFSIVKRSKLEYA